MAPHYLGLHHEGINMILIVNEIFEASNSNVEHYYGTHQNKVIELAQI